MRGFTFIEVMVAMLIFVLAVLAAINIVTNAVRATRDTRETTTATWLVQNVMAELEIKLETEGIDKGCQKKSEGKFEAPFEKFSWRSSCYEIDFKLTEAASQLKDQLGEDSSSQQDDSTNAVEKLITETASQYIAKSMRELHAEVFWTQGKTKRQVDVTTHFSRYDQPITVPGIGTFTNTGGTQQ